MTAPASRPIEFVAGDPYTHELRFFSDAAQTIALDVSGNTYAAQVRIACDSTAAILESFDVDMTDAATGIVVLGLTDVQTRAIYEATRTAGWDVAPTDSQTLFQGAVTVVGDYTR